ncbi:hypothetical protein Agsp01_28900 [Agromyces sp. NBRC 114283]|nr:hypothetical protein Agsp01_28900 [Agromyces sp. NBRC 114283]
MVRMVDGYLDWKGWSQDSFGAPRRGDDAYYRREVREAARIRRPLDVLEIGFGNGEFLGFGRRRGWRMNGTELLPELVDAANADGFSAHAADALPALPDESFDLVAAFDVFEHIPPELSVEFLGLLADKVRRDGLIVLRFPNADSWIGNPFQYGDVTHVNAIGILKMEYYARRCGLVIERVRGGTRRGFRTSLIHGLHLITAGVAIRIGAGVAKAMFFPGLRVVLSSSSVVVVLRRAS